ncbi:Bug family tripartite tricarboxylate transporter substrate binding protein [Achromobacter aegrifaciens]
MRTFKHLLSVRMAIMATAALAATGGVSAAQAAESAAGYPARPIRLVVSYGAGGSLDAMTRSLGQELGKELGQSAVVENFAGAGGTIGVKRVIAAAPDGYTLLMGITSDVALAPLTNETANYRSSDLLPIANIGTSGIVLIGRPDLQADNLAELLQLAKAQPGRLTYATSGSGSMQHVAMEDLKSRAGIDVQLIPYKSASNIVTDVLGGHVDLAVIGLPAVLPLIAQKKVKAYAVMSGKRDLGDKSIPAAGETPGLEGMDFALWTGMFAPKGTPAEIVEKMHVAVAKALTQPRVVEQFSKMGVEIAAPHSVAEFDAYVQNSQRQLQESVARVKIGLDKN